ncbi:methylated-DNA--[protein]-cysteine S-methyltransferase [Ohtaekwangia kribbensis]|jgi:methylated-DNA-[protein]-cysteine S-methyltransferase|uniref:Methylated-DNA--protein-cysteine methyltransferase n=1 Tax=Ohtaekwangia kribbensis TaxID=688913 RepID=A0ABW3K5S7_9BACT
MQGRAYYSSPVGDLLIESENDKIITVGFLRDSKKEEMPTATTDQCITELEEYFYKGRKFFDVELDLRGSAFQLNVWNALLTIPYGRTASYEDIAIRVGDMKSIRAVGLANGQNPIAIIVPCHRVIGKNGNLIGYGGGLENKEWLLYHEGAIRKQLSLF